MRVHRWFRSAMVWLGFLVAVLAMLQAFTSGGKVFWIFPTENIERVMGADPLAESLRSLH
jgi:hypothetical protein